MLCSGLLAPCSEPDCCVNLIRHLDCSELQFVWPINLGGRGRPLRYLRFLSLEVTVARNASNFSVGPQSFLARLDVVAVKPVSSMLNHAHSSAHGVLPQRRLGGSGLQPTRPRNAPDRQGAAPSRLKAAAKDASQRREHQPSARLADELADPLSVRSGRDDAAGIAQDQQKSRNGAAEAEKGAAEPSEEVRLEYGDAAQPAADAITEAPPAEVQQQPGDGGASSGPAEAAEDAEEESMIEELVREAQLEEVLPARCGSSGAPWPLVRHAKVLTVLGVAATWVTPKC